MLSVVVLNLLSQRNPMKAKLLTASLNIVGRLTTKRPADINNLVLYTDIYN